jgi:hypothetical protein
MNSLIFFMNTDAPGKSPLMRRHATRCKRPEYHPDPPCQAIVTVSCRQVLDPAGPVVAQPGSRRQPRARLRPMPSIAA